MREVYCPVGDCGLRIDADQAACRRHWTDAPPKVRFLFARRRARARHTLTIALREGRGRHRPREVTAEYHRKIDRWRAEFARELGAR